MAANVICVSLEVLEISFMAQLLGVIPPPGHHIIPYNVEPPSPHFTPVIDGVFAVHPKAPVYSLRSTFLTTWSTSTLQKDMPHGECSVLSLSLGSPRLPVPHSGICLRYESLGRAVPSPQLQGASTSHKAHLAPPPGCLVLSLEQQSHIRQRPLVSVQQPQALTQSQVVTRSSTCAPTGTAQVCHASTHTNQAPTIVPTNAPDCWQPGHIDSTGQLLWSHGQCFGTAISRCCCT